METSYCTHCRGRMGLLGGRFKSVVNPAMCQDCYFQRKHVLSSKPAAEEVDPASPDVPLKQLGLVALSFIAPLLFVLQLYAYFAGRIWTDRRWEDYDAADWTKGAVTAIAIVAVLVLVTVIVGWLGPRSGFSAEPYWY